MEEKLLFKTVCRAMMLILMMNCLGSINGYSQSVPQGAINGLFTVNNNKSQVYFSQGNLQYIGSAATPYWKFADNQWDYFGETTGQNSNNQNVDRDLFGWGTSGYHDVEDPNNVNYQPWDVSVSTINSEYNTYGYGPSTNMNNPNLNGSSANYDWGVNNAINNGGNQSGRWRTLTSYEWGYVLYNRVTSSGIRFAKAKVNDVNGVIVLPDDWQSSYYSLNNTNNSYSSYTNNVITMAQWITLEQHGAVFLPAAGTREGAFVGSTGSRGYYWSVTCGTASDAANLYFADNNMMSSNSDHRSYGRSVRLICPAQYDIQAYTNTEVGYYGTVSGRGNYRYGTSCTLIATPFDGYVFAYWTENGAFVSNEASYTFTVTKERTLMANFIPHGDNIPEGAIEGLFSVSGNKQVYFSRGNLQYIGSAGTPYWQFAENQWDYLGTTTSQNSNNQSVDRDLFGWATSGYNHGAVCYQPWSTNKDEEDYYAYGSYSYNLYDQTGKADWGYNAISNGGNQQNLWHTLTNGEWNYVLNTRVTSSGLRYAKAVVNGVNGIILLPDDWNADYYSLNNTNNNGADFGGNSITAQQWNSLEQRGAIFLPAAGDRSGTSIFNAGNYGIYWSSSRRDDSDAYYFEFNSNTLATDYDSRYYGSSVRLVRPTSLKLPVSGYGSGSGKWVFIASPVVEDLNPTTVTNLIGGGTAGNYDYDLFRYNPSAALGWENYVNHTDGFVLQNGKGYLYAREETADIEFIGTLNTGTIKTVALNQGWNLVGNPFVTAVNVNKPFYRMNETGTDIEPVSAYTTTDIPACTGVVVKATGTSETVTFTQSTSKASSGDNGLQMTLTKTGARGNEIHDKAIVCFNEDAQLEKFVFNEDHAKLYIFQDDEDFAIAFSERKSEIPVHFVAKELGTYTISFSGENMSDIKLVDKLENVIIDLGVNDGYTFIGSPADSRDRFRLVFGDSIISTGLGTEVFAYQNGNEIIINGDGELQVFDVMGRMVATQHINGVQTIAAPQTGVYILKLDGKTQKVVVR
ncbi:MAG: hypothetical protein II401_02070 [Bacteroidales bacterium]|nr:hypothetical protein [Bacteroidales bacterium]